jgi:hypothetical protein
MLQSREVGITCSRVGREKKIDTDYRFDNLGVDGMIMSLKAILEEGSRLI